MTTAEAAASRNVRLYYAFLFLMEFGLWFAIWIKYLTVTRGFELKYIFLMDLPFWLMVAALEAPFGALADKAGHKRVLALGAAVYSVTILGFGFTTDYWSLFAVYMLWAVAMACRSGADQALLYDSLKEAGQEGRFPRIVGRGFAITISAGLTGVILGGILASQTSLAFTVQVSPLGPLLAIGVALAMVEPRAAHVERHYLEGLKQGFSFAWQTPQVRYSVLLGSVMMLAAMVPVFLAQPFLIEHDIPTGAFGFYQAPLNLAAVAGALFAYRIASKAGAPRLFAGASLLTVLAFAGLAIFQAPPAFAFFVVPALVRGIVRPTMDSYINTQTPSDRRATVLSVASLAFSLQIAFVEPVMGFIIDGINIAAGALFAAVLFAVVMPPLVYLWRRTYLAHPPELAIPTAVEPTPSAAS